MWRCANLLLVALPVCGLAQDWEGAAGSFVESGTLTTEEAAALEEHLMLSGWPVSVEEAAAVRGLSPESAARLMADPLWQRWAQSATSGTSRSRLRVDWDVRRALGLATDQTVMGNPMGLAMRCQRSGHWALRIDKGPGERGVDHLAGFVIAPKWRGVETVWGDHVIRWGQGLVGWSASAYDGMRSATSAQRMTLSVRPVLAGDALPVRRGVALSVPLAGGQGVASLDAGSREVRLEAGVPVTWYLDGQHRTEAECSREVVRPIRLATLWHRSQASSGWGVAMECGGIPGAVPAEAVVGMHAFRHFRSSRWVGEWAWSGGGWSGTLGAIWTWSERVDGFCRWEHLAPDHPSRRWGDARATGKQLWTWGLESKGRRWEHFVRWEWNGAEAGWEWQVQHAPSKTQRWTARCNGGASLRVHLEYRVDKGDWGARIWCQTSPHQGYAAGAMWSWQAGPGWPILRFGWARSNLAPGILAYRLEPNAQTWQTAVLAERGQRWWCQGSWTLTRHWKFAASAACAMKEGVRMVVDSGPWQWRGNAQGEIRLRLSYAM